MRIKTPDLARYSEKNNVSDFFFGQKITFQFDLNRTFFGGKNFIPVYFQEIWHCRNTLFIDVRAEYA